MGGHPVKKSATIFDRQFREEDLKLLDSGTQTMIKEETKMLLRKYNTEIFEPDIRELFIPSSGEIDSLMEKTAAARPGRRTFPWRILALAASIMVVCGIAFFVVHDGGKGEIGTQEQGPVPQTVFRGQSPTTAVMPPKSNEKKEPLAYLADFRGTVKIQRSGQTDITPSGACEVLYADDIVSLDANAGAKMIYSDAFFEIKGMGQYRVQTPDPVSADDRTATPKVLFRGQPGSGGGNMVVPPSTMLAAVVAPITRAKGDNVAVYSPRGASFTATPEVRIAGDPSQTYEVCVLDLEGKIVGKSVSMRGGASVPWKTISDTPLAEDEIYHLRIRCGGKIVNDQNESSFWRLSGAERENLMTALRQVDSIQAEATRLFFRANALYMNGCHSEAYAIVDDLLQKNPNVKFYVQLKVLCKISLKI